GQLPQGHDARAADHRARGGPQPHPQPGAGGSLRAHHRGRRHGARAAGGHGLDPRSGQTLDTRYPRASARGHSEPSNSQKIKREDFLGEASTRAWERIGMAQDLGQVAKERGIRYFMISFTDLFGFQRAKLVPAAAISDIQKDGAGFAGFATWLDMTPTHPDMLGMADPAGLIQLPWKPEVAWVPADC